MKRSVYARKALAWTLCLVMLVSTLALPALAVEEGAPPAAPAEAAPAAKAETPKAEAPAEKAEAPKAEAPVEKAETPAEKAEAPKAEAPAEKVETPAEKEEAPAVKEETPAKASEAPAKASEAPTKASETPAKASETPAKASETPAKASETPAKASETPAKASETPAKASETPAKASETPDEDEETPAQTVAPTVAPARAPMRAPAVPEPVEADEPDEVDEPDETDNAATLFSLDDASDNGFVIDWDDEELQQGSWAGQVGAVETSDGFYIYVATGLYNGAYAEIATPGEYGNTVVLRIRCDASWGDPGTATADGAPIAGSDVLYYEEDDTRYSEIFIPKSILPASDTGYVVQVSGDSILFDFPVDPLSDAEAVYTGITIDGRFSDWAAVPKTETDNSPAPYVPQVPVDMAVVWDGDYVYIYFDYKDGNANGLSSYGPRSSGQFAIVTDLGRTMLIRPNIDTPSSSATVDGVNGASIAVDNYGWSPTKGHKVEIAIPASALPEYLESFSFGYYMEEPIITGIVNMQDTPGGVDPFKANVVIDGKYNDWVGYPHSLIEYDEPGIQHHKVDGEGALWSDDGWLYGHVVTEHPDHLDEKGSCFLAAIEIAFNGDREYKDLPEKGNFYPRILAINEDGTIIDYYKTLNEGHSTPNGTYTYYIFDTRTDPIWQFGHTDENGVWHDATAADLIENAFGTMKVTVTGTRDEAEFKLDLEKVAAYIGQDADTAFKTIDIHWGRIGPQWITTAGTPTGPILGVALAVGAIGAPVCYGEIKKRRGAKKVQDGDEAK